VQMKEIKKEKHEISEIFYDLEDSMTVSPYRWLMQKTFQAAISLLSRVLWGFRVLVLYAL